MSKNSYEITGSVAGTLFLTALLLTVAWGWLLLPWMLGVLSTLCTALTVRYPLWIVPFAPITITIGAMTLLRSLIWHRRGKVHWKGRTYTG
jgi:hypothetical protein